MPLTSTISCRWKLLLSKAKGVIFFFRDSHEQEWTCSSLSRVFVHSNIIFPIDEDNRSIYFVVLSLSFCEFSIFCEFLLWNDLARLLNPDYEPVLQEDFKEVSPTSYHCLHSLCLLSECGFCLCHIIAVTLCRPGRRHHRSGCSRWRRLSFQSIAPTNCLGSGIRSMEVRFVTVAETFK